MVLGVQQDFSWRQVGLAALGGAVSGALGGIPGTDGITRVSPGLIDTDAFARVGTLLGLAQRCGCRTVPGREMMRGQIARMVDFFLEEG